jgi:hypothetical protein
MKRILLFLPAILSGLAAGFLLQTVLKHGPPAAADQQNQGTPEPGSGVASSMPLSRLEDLVEARLPLPVMPSDPREVQLRLMELSQPGRSPVRSALAVEVFESILPVDGVPDALFLNGAGSPRGVQAVARLAREKPRKALINVNAHANWNRLAPDQAHTLRRQVFHEWLRHDPEAALAEMTGRSAGAVPDPDTISVLERGANLRAFVEAWAALNPAAAGAALGSLPESGPGATRSDLAAILFQEWHQSDAVAAWQWAEQQDKKVMENLASLAEELGAPDPAARTGLLLNAPVRDSSRLVPAFADWMNADPQAAVAKMASIRPEDEFWQHQASSVVQRWATAASLTSSPENVAVEALENFPSGLPREAFLKGLVEFGASNDLPFAVRMVAEMAEGRPRTEAMGSLTELWMRKDPAALSEWLNHQPASESRHAAVSRFAALLALSDPGAAAQWAASLPDGYPEKAKVLQTVREAMPDPPTAAP